MTGGAGRGTHGGTGTGAWLAPGTRLNDLYEIDEGIAAGGMGEIYRGHAILTGDPVAIKTIRSDVAETETALTMFRKEAAALHNLYHEAIVRYYVFSVDPTLRRPYLAMEYVSGPSLSNMVRNGALAYEEVRVLGARLASGLQAAHERGIIHRDISPDNVILPHADPAQAKIIDFGIARQTRAGEGTIVGDGFAGKYNYVSPEQLGLFGGDVGAASDIYSLGLVLVEAATGRALDMRGTPVEVIEKRRAVPNLSAVDHRLRPLLERMLAPDPRHRPGSMTEVVAWLRRGTLTGLSRGGATDFQEATVVSARPQTLAGATFPPEDTRGPGARLGLVAGLAGAVLAIAAAGLGAYWFLRDRPATIVAERVDPPPPSASAPAAPSQAPAGSALALVQITPSDAGQATAQEIARRLDGKIADACALVDPVVVADDRAAVDGYARSASAFSTLRSDLQSAYGLTLDLRLNEVTAGQCPMLEFASGARANKNLMPSIEMVAYRVRPGGGIAGEVFGARGSYLTVLAAFADGTARVVLASQRLDAASARFEIAPEGRLLPAGAPLLIIAIGSSGPLDALRRDATQPADRLLAQVQQYAETSGMRLAAAPAYVQVQ